jgi:dihydropteroate synthase
MVTLRCGDRVLELGGPGASPARPRTFVMGILNVTPDSFSDGGALSVGPVGSSGAGGASIDLERAVARAEELLAAGADILDIGGESTRPGAAPVDPDTEEARVLPVVQALAARGIRNLSVDTRNARTAARALEAGASWINDVSALRHDPEMARVARAADAVVLMHWRPAAAQDAREDRVRYGDVVLEVKAFLQERIAAALAAGLARERLVVDPGLGFGKTVEDNLALLRAGTALAEVAPVLVGPSRKRFLGALTGIEDPARRDAATVGAVAFAALHGAALVRVHDVRAAVEALRVVDALRGGPPSGG